MGKIRSSTMFRLLCWAIGTMAVGLLGLAGFMVYTYLVPSEALAIPSPTVTPLVATAKPVRVQQNSDAWETRFWPQETPGQADSMPADAVDESGQVMFVGIMGDCAVFQNKTTRKQWGVWIGESGEGVKVIGVTDKVAMVEINSQKVKLNKVKPVDLTGAKGGRGRPITRGGPMVVNMSGQPGGPGQPTAGSGTVPATSIRTTTTSSARLSSGGNPVNPSYAQPISAASAAAASGGNPVNPSSAQRFTSQPIRTGRSSGGSSGQPSGVSVGSAGQPNGATGSTNSDTNWRKYWADRMKARQDQQNTSPPQPQPK